jgi:flagellar basal body-associated protein FliL
MVSENTSNKLTILGFVLAYALVFVGLGAVGYHYIPKTGGDIRVSKKIDPTAAADLSYIDLPPVIISVGGDDDSRINPRVRVDLALEVARKDREIVVGYQPYITERVGRMLGTLSTEEIAAPRNMSWIKSEMLQAINDAGAPAPVQAVIFRRFVLM